MTRRIKTILNVTTTLALLVSVVALGQSGRLSEADTPRTVAAARPDVTDVERVVSSNPGGLRLLQSPAAPAAPTATPDPVVFKLAPIQVVAPKAEPTVEEPSVPEAEPEPAEDVVSADTASPTPDPEPTPTADEVPLPEDEGHDVAEPELAVVQEGDDDEGDDDDDHEEDRDDDDDEEDRDDDNDEEDRDDDDDRPGNGRGRGRGRGNRPSDD